LTLRHEGFTIEHYADGSAAGYEARVVVAAREQEVRRSIRLNEPLAAPGVGLYLYGYGPTEHGYSVTLLAVHDPGYGLVIAAGFLLLLGMTVRFTMT
jgi:cytochrome c biogenesis protein ResB